MTEIVDKVTNKAENLTNERTNERTLRVLVACEESQRTCTEFRKLGHEAYSCDIIPCSGGHPEWHIQADCLPLLDGDCKFETADEVEHYVKEWDIVIAHPPCTFLTLTANSWYEVEKYGEKARKRQRDRYKAIVFFMHFVLAHSKRVAVENPVGVMNTAYRKPDCIVHPYMFGDDAKKKTCFWLKGLPPLMPTEWIEPTTVPTGHGTDSPWHAYTWNLPKEERSRERSKTFPGIAKAMAEQWSNFTLNDIERR